MIREVYRFEGVSDPDIDAFGVYADPAKAAVLAEIPVRRRWGTVT